jgi:hypothetical protein
VSDLLLPCPFCGSDALVRQCYHSMPREPTFRVSCTYCLCGTSDDFATAEAAAELWNRRAQSAEIARLTRERDEAESFIYWNACDATLFSEEEANRLEREALERYIARAALSPSPGETHD